MHQAEFEESIIEDLALLNIKADQISHTSDHFDTLHALAIKLIKDGNAYADDTLQMQVRRRRSTPPSRIHSSILTRAPLSARCVTSA